MSEKQTNEEFIAEGLKEADEMEIQRLKDNAEVAALINHSKKAVDFIEVGKAKVRFQSFISRTVRRQLDKARPKETDSIEEAEKTIYLTLSLLCLDDPWNKVSTWDFIEAQGGDASEYLGQIMEKITKRAKQMRTFQ